LKGITVFQGIINNAKAAAGSMVAKYAVRASVAVPFIVALGFATAAVTLMLIERFGHQNAYFMVASGFAVIGLLAGLIVRTKEHDEVTAEAHSTATDTAGIATDTAAAAAVQLPLALLGTLFSSPVGPSSILSLVRGIGRNLPLVLLLAGIGMLFWPKNSAEDPESAADEFTPPAGLRPNGRYTSSNVHPA
jgi:hypothetical protein